MSLTQVERNIANKVVDRFVNLKESTGRKSLVIEFEDPVAINRLWNWQLLKTSDNTNYLPTALSFHYCGNAKVEAITRRGLEVLAEVFKRMYLRDNVDLSPEGLQEAATKIDKHVDEQMIRLGLYVAADFGLLAGCAGGNPQQPDITPTGISEQVVKLKNIDTLWDNYMRDRIPWPVQDSMGGIVPRHPMFEVDDDEEPLIVNDESSSNGILVLISHSSKDKVLAAALIDLLRSGLGLLASQIRCSSVDGYRLPAGVNTHDQLRKEVKSAKVLIGLLTPNSLSSTYVLFELGARWGAGLFMIPLLAGAQPEEMRGPHGVLNALSCETEGQLIQLVEDCGRQLNLEVQSAASYIKQVNAVKSLSEAIPTVVAGRHLEPEQMFFEESVCWKRKSGRREGPYCPVCYDDKHKAIHLNPGATKGTYGCGSCQNSFYTNEHNERAFQ